MDASIHSRNPGIAQLRRRGVLIAAKAVGCLILLCMSLTIAPAAADPVRNVLVIYSDNRLLPANLEVDAALREALVGPTKSGVELYTEFLDRSRFAGAAYEATTSTYLAEKYANALPEVVVAGGEYALRFLTDHRAALFPNVPIVFVGLSPSEIEALGPLPNDVIGVPVEFDYGGTIDQALRFHPNATRLILITGANRFDRRDEVELAGIVPRLNGRVSVESLSGQPIDAIVKRVRTLGGTDIVLRPGSSPTAPAVSSVRANRCRSSPRHHAHPVYGPFNTFIGSGIVGGRMPSYSAIGKDAAGLVSRLIEGVPANSIEVPAHTASALQIDWRQARRWGITEKQLPDDAVVRFREPTFWEAYGHAALIALAVIMLQTGLIAALLYERRLQRRTASALGRRASGGWCWPLAPRG